jgi:hypothetical protein
LAPDYPDYIIQIDILIFYKPYLFIQESGMTKFMAVICTSLFASTTLFVNNAEAQWTNSSSNAYLADSSKSVSIGRKVFRNKLDVNGALGVGSGYAGVSSAPTDGMIVKGNVGLGTTTVRNKLDVEGSVAIGSSYSGSYTAPTNGLLVQGKTGVGTYLPKGALDVRGFTLLDTVKIRKSLLIADTTQYNMQLVSIVDSMITFGSAYPAGQPVPYLNLKKSGMTIFSGGTSSTRTTMVTKDSILIQYNAPIAANCAKTLITSQKIETPTLRVGNGTTWNSSNYKLAVEGTIGARELVVTTDAFADYVFADNYKMNSLAEVDSYIKENKHLPGIPSSEEAIKNGINVAQMQVKLLEKVEELTLHMIDMKKENDQLKTRILELEKQSVE